LPFFEVKSTTLARSISAKHFPQKSVSIALGGVLGRRRKLQEDDRPFGELMSQTSKDPLR
jgi:hypothetical protein